MRTSRFAQIAAAGVLLAAAASAQQFRIVVTQAGNAVSVQNGAQLTFNSAVGSSLTASVLATYTGTGTLTINNPPQLFGSTAFSVSSPAELPVTLNPGASIAFEIRYRPANASAANAQVILPFIETTSTNTSTQGTLQLSLLGTAPSFSVSYILQSDQNIVPIPPNGTLTFDPTVINTVGQAALNISNLGSGSGNVTGITLVSGDAFRLTRTPLLPTAVPSGQALQVVVLYQPLRTGTDSGQIQITFDSGPPVLVNLSGRGISSRFVYEILDSTIQGVVPGGTIELPSVAIGQTSTVVIQISNQGDSPGTINSINVTGTGFQAAIVPALPQIVAPNASVTLTIAFTPTRAGVLTGNLIVNSDRFVLSGRGLGTQLSFSYVAAGSTITVDNNTPVFFPATAITQSSNLLLKVKNTGTLDAVISNVGVQSEGPFALASPLQTPIILAPEAEFQVPLVFTPTTVGFVNGALRVDNNTVNLTGSGTRPPPMPSFSFTGVSAGNVTPGPVNVGLSLNSTYPVAIAGTLTVRSSSTLPADPAVQFSTGGQTVRFSIPANSRAAIFAAQGQQIGLQTGTVAGTVILSAVFSTESGGVDLTPASAPTLELTVAPARPVLLSLQVAATTSGVTITVGGFATTRTLTTMTVEFTPKPGVSMANNRFTIDLRATSSAWFRNVSSQAFGGQFSVGVPFSLQSSVAGQTGAATLQTVSVTISNEIGDSQAIQTTVIP
jgi:hypothetical protein